MLEHELTQAQINDTYYQRIKHDAQRAQQDETLLDDSTLAKQLKTTISRLLNQAIRLNTLDPTDPDYALLNQVRLQNTDRVNELLKIWEPIEENKRRKKMAERQAMAVSGRKI